MSEFTPLPAGPYGAILADPPWAFRSWSGKRGTPHRSAEDHYRTLPEASLCRLPVAAIAAPDCALFLWVVDSHLDAGLRVAAAWGFQFKTVAFVWSKGRIGMGYWTRKQAELCLLFTRGKPRRLDRGVRQVIAAPRREHSRKPDAVYERVERLVGGPYAELFARGRSRPGWGSWGDQVETEAGTIAGGRG